MAKIVFKNIPTEILSQDEIVEMVDAFRKGDFSLKDRFILYHIRIVLSVALKIPKETEAMQNDIVGEAFLQLCKIPKEVQEGRLKDYGLTPYTLSRIKTVCRNFMRMDRVLAIPTTTAHTTGKRISRMLAPIPKFGFGLDSDNFLFHYSCRHLALIYGLMDPHTTGDENARLLLKEILSCAKSEGERLVILYRSQEYTDTEIAHIMGTSTATIRNHRINVEKRFKELKDKESED